jgi:hypothetical protein
MSVLATWGRSFEEAIVAMLHQRLDCELFHEPTTIKFTWTLFCSLFVKTNKQTANKLTADHMHACIDNGFNAAGQSQ